MTDAAEGAIPIADGANGWSVEKIIKVYTGDNDLIGYIPDTVWVAAYMAAQKALLKLLPDSAAADAGKLLQVGADGNAAWGDKMPTALKSPKALTFTGAATGTYDGSEALTITIPEGGSGGSTGGGLRKMSAVSRYIGIPVAELPQDGTIWMCISKGDGAELYSGTVTIEGGSLTANNLIAVSGGTTAQLNQATIVSVGFAIYGMSATDYTGVWQEVGAGGTIPGTDLSLGVTGATVGQIAKITAVDAQGKPTAWAPVDLPNGVIHSNGELLLSAEASDVAVFSKNFDTKSYGKFLFFIGGIKGSSAISIGNGDFSIGGMSFNICYYTGWLDATNTSYPNGCISETFERVTDDIAIVTYGKHSIAMDPSTNVFQGNSSQFEKMSQGYLKGSTKDTPDGIKLKFSGTVSHVKVAVYGYR